MAVPRQHREIGFDIRHVLGILVPGRHARHGDATEETALPEEKEPGWARP